MKKISLIGALAISTLLANQNTLPVGSVAGSHGIVFPEGKKRFVFKYASFTKDSAYDGDTELTDPREIYK